jgi:flagellar assembly factor FliW
MTSVSTVEEARVLRSHWLGDIECDESFELLFPLGLPGFERERRMVPLEIPGQRPLVYLQSAANPEICFVTLPVLVIDPDFELHLSEDDRAVLDLPDHSRPVIGADVLCLALLTQSENAVQSNVTAPIVINLHNGRGLQCAASAGDRAIYRLGAQGWEKVC